MSSAPVPEELTTAWLEQEIQQAQSSLRDKEHRLAVAADEQEDPSLPESTETVAARLHRLGRTARDLEILQDVTSWNEAFAKDAMETDQDDGGGLSADTKRCMALGELLCRHAERKDDSSLPSQPSAVTLTPLWLQLYQQEYEPLYEYLRASWLLAFRRQLQQSQCSTPTGSQRLLQECEDKIVDGSFAQLATCCEAFTRLQLMQQQVFKYVAQSGLAQPSDTMDQQDAVLPLVLELCRPIVERVKFHFVKPSPDRPTSTRIERLPEWLLSFVREKFLEPGGLWELVSYGLEPHVAASVSSPESDGGWSLSLAFLNELVRTVQWVLGERNFFRDAKLCGPASKPLLLCNAIEQLLQFDEYVQCLVPANQTNRLLSLMDVFVAGDEELLAWWLEREREAVFSTLFPDEEHDGKPKERDVNNHISPRAELFCSLIHSIQAKAAVFSFSGPYISAVASPLCMQFLEAVHASSTDMKNVLTQRKLPTDDVLMACIHDWIELINGTHMAKLVLLQGAEGDDADPGETAPSLSGEQDLARFGRSLDHLEDVLADEFATAFVDSLLMERAKFAGYVMRCSHLLSIEHVSETVVNETEVSTDLQETRRLLSALLEVCDSVPFSTDTKINTEGEIAAAGNDAMTFAPCMMRDCVLSRVAVQLLEVVLDMHGMTPDLFLPGCMLFARDVNALLGISLLPTPALRLLEITKVMTMASPDLVQLGNTLCGLAGRSPPLTEEAFTEDSRIFDEAMSMIRAKGLVWIELSDLLSILNRRRDLGLPPPAVQASRTF